MSTNPYELAKGKRLTYKGGALATLNKSIEKKKKKRRQNKQISQEEGLSEMAGNDAEGSENPSGENDIYSIDAAKRMKYDDLFPVEAKKFGYDPKAKTKKAEEALDDRVKKKADRYCK